MNYAMKIDLAYGREGLTVEIPDDNLYKIVKMSPTDPIADVEGELERVLANPIGTKSLKELAEGRDNACVVISDITRPVPNKVILPPLLRILEESGIARDKIVILNATGTHRPNTEEELIEMMGEEIVKNYKIVNHFCRDVDSNVYLGDTPLGVPAYIDKTYLNADLKIITGLIEPHFMAGYSGGRKIICPGISSLETLKHFHGPKLLEPAEATNCVLDGNPVHETALAVAKMAGVDFNLNVTIDEARRITGIFAGELEASHLAGVKAVDKVVKVPIDREADIVVTTSAGYPLDATYYQTVKGMVGAMDIVKSGGTILIASQCSEGIGSAEFQKLLMETTDIDEYIEMLYEPGYFSLDQWEVEELIKAKRKAEIMLFTEGIAGDDLNSLLATPVESVEKGIEMALERHSKEAKIAVIPKGPYVIPYVS